MDYEYSGDGKFGWRALEEAFSRCDIKGVVVFFEKQPERTQ